MTDKEKVNYTIDFLSKMANGINPIDGTQIKEDDLLNNVRISRCLFYTIDLLKNYSKENKVKKSDKEKFSLTEAQKDQVEIEDNLSMSEFVGRINALIDNNTMAKLKSREVNAYLIRLGYLEQIEKNNRKKNVPTQKGLELGIKLETRITLTNAFYTVNLYSMSAQIFILEHLEEI